MEGFNKKNSSVSYTTTTIPKVIFNNCTISSGLSTFGVTLSDKNVFTTTTQDNSFSMSVELTNEEMFIEEEINDWKQLLR